MSAPLSTATLIERYIPQDAQARYELQFTPEAQRHPAAALLAFEREMRELVALQKDVAPVKIHWWHEELQRLRDGTARHPLTQALAAYASESMHEALNEMLHGAVMDFNAVEIDARTQQRYFQMRGGALHTALALAAGRRDGASDDLAAAMALTDILSEARDPAFSGVPAASLVAAVEPAAPAASAAGPDSQAAANAVEAPLREERERAAAALDGRRLPSATSAVRLALYNARWPLIMASPYGTVPPAPSPLRTLWIAWRAATRYARQDNSA